MVIFDPFWRMNTGNLLLGRLVSQRRKSLCTFWEFVKCVVSTNNVKRYKNLRGHTELLCCTTCVNVQTFTGSMFSMSLSRAGIQLGER